jgi:hypothetical protein
VTWPFKKPPFYSMIDYDGIQDTGAASGGLQTRNTAGMPGFTSNAFPNFDTLAGYDFGKGPLPSGRYELTDHPLYYNFFKPSTPGGADDRMFGLSNLEALLRYGDTGVSAMTSELFRLCPWNLSGMDPMTGTAAALRRRNLLTTHSFDIDRPSLTPYIWDPLDAANGGTGAYTLAAGLFPTGGTFKYPQPQNGTTPLPTPPANSEFGWSVPALPPGIPLRGGYRGDAEARITAILRRLDLNRPLPNYPDPAPNGVIDLTPGSTSQTQFQAAQNARVQLAQDIYAVLRTVTGAADPATVTPSMPGVPNPQFEALRWLAQLAVNIVDYIDNDDYSTPFPWFTGGTPPATYYVYGVELPRLVINEAYAAFNATTAPASVRVWVELLNPLNAADASLSDNGQARLENPNPATPGAYYAIYRLLLCQGASLPPGTNAYLMDPQNPRGGLGMAPGVENFTPNDPNPPATAGPNGLVYNQLPPNGALPAMVTQFHIGAGPPPAPGQAPLMPMDSRFVQPCIGGRDTAAMPGINSNDGYYVIGPPGPLPVTGAGAPTLARDEMVYDPGVLAGATTAPPPTIVLQRLACPRIPPQLNPALPNYNPYITVDYMADVQMNGGTPAPAVDRSDSRQQPYGALKTAGTVAGQTFFARNAGAVATFDWLVHLDRPLRNAMELLHVSACKPSQLAQQFMTGTGPTAGTLNVNRFKHQAPWFDQSAFAVPAGQSARLYRALEFLQTRSLALGLSAPVTTCGAIAAAGPGVTVTPAPMRGVSPSGSPWNIRAGSVVMIDAGLPTWENVRVISSNGASFTADFVMAHPGTPTITLTDMGDRVPGKININTIWDPETLQAICDPQSSNTFQNPPTATPTPTAATKIYDPAAPFTAAGSIFADLVTSRTPNIATWTLGSSMMTTALNPLGPDRPFLSLTQGLTPVGGMPTTADLQYPTPPPAGLRTFRGIDDTILRPGATIAGTPSWDRRILAPTNLPTKDGTTPNPTATPPIPPDDNPYFRLEMLAKTFGQFTTRSNVFAVWLTVGFFEVTDESVRPVRLGAEIGRAENRHIRHRMFGIIDRTNLLTQQTADPATAAGTLPPGIPTPVLPYAQPVQGSVAAISPGVQVVQLDPNRGMSGVAQITTVTSAIGPTPPLTWTLGWSIQGTPPGGPPTRGSVLQVENEVVVVTAVNTPGNPLPNFTATFTLPHPAGAPISVFYTPGNPGPATRFDFHNNTAVVPFASVIK